LHEAIRLKPDGSEAHVILGAVLITKGDIDAAIVEYREAIRLKPGYSIAHNDLGVALSQKGDFDAAMTEYREAIRLNPDYPESHYNLGSQLRAKGDFPGAINEYNEALRLKPGNASTLRGRGITDFYVGQYAAARDDLRQSLQADPGNLNTALWLYLAQAKLGEDARAALAAHSVNFNLAEWPGPIVNLFLDKIDEKTASFAALEAWKKKNSGQFCQALFFSGEQGLLSNRRDDAVRYFQGAVAAGPKDLFEYQGAVAELSRLVSPNQK
jgi:lipoprotein NlpI